MACNQLNESASAQADSDSVRREIVKQQGPKYDMVASIRACGREIDASTEASVASLAGVHALSRGQCCAAVGQSRIAKRLPGQLELVVWRTFDWFDSIAS